MLKKMCETKISESTYMLNILQKLSQSESDSESQSSTKQTLDDCCICLDQPVDPVMLKCGHYFHHDCVTRWIDEGKNTCPICRSLIDDTIEETNSSDEIEIELERWIGGSNVEEYFVDRITGDVYIEISDGFTLVGYRMPNSDNGNFIQLAD